MLGKTYGNPLKCNLNLYEIPSTFKLYLKNGTKKVIGTAYYYCKGEVGCQSNTPNKKCDFSVSAAIFADDPNYVIAELHGNHNNFGLLPVDWETKLSIVPEVKAIVQSLRTGIRAKPSAIMNALITRAALEGYTNNPQQVPSLKQIQEMIKGIASHP